VEENELQQHVSNGKEFLQEPFEEELICCIIP
jgi:hypothetical protein